MKTYSLTQAKNRIGDVLATVSRGEAVRVTKRGKPVFSFGQGQAVIVQAVIAKNPGNLQTLKILAKKLPLIQSAGTETASSALAAARYRHG